MKHSLFLAFFLLSINCLYSQLPKWEWSYAHQGVPSTYNPAGHCEVDRFGNSYFISLRDSTSIITKYSNSGIKLWQKEVIGIMNDVAIDKNGNCYFGGSKSSWSFWTPSNGSYGILMKLDPSGIEVWNKKYLGYKCNFNSLSITNQDELAIVGNFRDSLQFDQYKLKSPESFILASISLNGAANWVRSDTNSNWMNAWTSAEHLVIDQQNNFVFLFTGYQKRGVVKMNSQGQLINSLIYGDSDNKPFGLCTDHKSNLYLSQHIQTGTSSSMGVLTKFSSSLTTQWNLQVHFGQGGDYNLVSEPSYSFADSTLYVAGYVGAWANGIQTIIIGDDTIVGIRNADAIITAVDPKTGIIQNSYRIAGNSFEWVIDLASDEFGNLYCLGAFEDSICFDSKCLVRTIQNYPTYFAAKLRMSDKEFTDAVGIDSKSRIDLTIFPNPVNDKIIVQGVETVSKFLSLYNSQGQLMIDNRKLSESTTIDISHLQSGLYYLRITSDLKSQTFKLLIQH